MRHLSACIGDRDNSFNCSGSARRTLFWLVTATRWQPGAATPGPWKSYWGCH